MLRATQIESVKTDNETIVKNASGELQAKAIKLNSTLINVSDITTLQTMVNDIDAELVTQQQSITNLSTTSSTHTSQIGSLQTADVTLGSRLGAAEANITTLLNRHLYCHVIKLGSNNPGYLTTMILSTSADAMTFSNFCNWLNSHGFTDDTGSIENNNKRYWCTGAGQVAYINMISAPTATQLRMFYSGFQQTTSLLSSVTWYSDTPVQIF